MIICCGESLIDMLPRKMADGKAGFAPSPGGAVFNTAIALGRLGTPVALLSGVSRDLFGDMLVASLQASNVLTSSLVRSDQPTTLAFVTLKDGQATYTFFDENSAGRMLYISDMPVPAAKAFFFGGISLAADPAGHAYETMMAQVAPDCVTMLDPNVRAAFISDDTAYRARCRGTLDRDGALTLARFVA
ncbi:MAG: PfkB family carbohydrate kinase, partial [Halocynthiibacter sp.]